MSARKPNRFHTNTRTVIRFHTTNTSRTRGDGYADQNRLVFPSESIGTGESNELYLDLPQGAVLRGVFCCIQPDNWCQKLPQVDCAALILSQMQKASSFWLWCALFRARFPPVFMCLRRRLVTFFSGGTMHPKLYHQTDDKTAKTILQTQQIKPGNGGVAGIMWRAIRSLMLPPGFCISSLTRTVACFAASGSIRSIRTSGVLPIESKYVG